MCKIDAETDLDKMAGWIFNSHFTTTAPSFSHIMFPSVRPLRFGF